MDRLRLIEFSPGGRPIEHLNLHNADGSMQLVRDTLAITPPERRSSQADIHRRYGGAHIVGETHGNGAVEAEWYINGGSADASLALMEEFLHHLEKTDEPHHHFVEWRPDGASRSVYWEVRGATPWQPMYRWVEFSTTKTLHLKAGFITAPLALGDRYTIDDPFDVDSREDYTHALGLGSQITWTAGSGLGVTAASDHIMLHTARGYKYADAQHTVKFRTGAVDNYAGTVFKYLDANNYLMVVQDAANLQVFKVTGGVQSAALGSVAWNTSPNTVHWITSRIEGNIIYVEGWNREPELTGTPDAAGAYQMTDAEAMQFGVGVEGDVGIRWIPAGTDHKLLSFSVEPFVYKSRLDPVELQIDPIPGNAPALLDLTLALHKKSDYAGTTKDPQMGVIAWTKELRPGNMVRSGSFESGQVSPVSGWTTAIEAGYNTAVATSITDVQNSLVAADGKGYAEVVVPATAGAGVNFKIYRKFERGRKYTVRYKIRAASATSTITVKIGNTGATDAASTGFALTSTWTERTFTWTPTADRPSAVLAFFNAAATAATYQIDSVVVEPANRPSEQSLLAPSGSAPIGFLSAPDAASLTNAALVADTDATQGFRADFSAAAGSGLLWNISPTLLHPDEFTEDEINLEVWARIRLPVTSLISPRAVVYASNGEVTRYTQEYNTIGLAMAPPLQVDAVNGSQYGLARLGSLILPADSSLRHAWTLGVTMYWAGTGTPGIDYVMVVPARSRAATPTNKPVGGAVGYENYPGLFSNLHTSRSYVKKIKWDLSTQVRSENVTAGFGGPTGWTPSNGLGGQLLEYPPGAVRELVKVTDTHLCWSSQPNYPRDLRHTLSFRHDFWPRYFLSRGD
jgi:hypothetical protein